MSNNPRYKLAHILPLLPYDSYRRLPCSKSMFISPLNSLA